MRLFRYISIILCILFIGFYIYRSSPHYQIIKGEIFGTYYNIKIRTDRKDKSLRQKIKQELDMVDARMSVFNTDSEISKINQAKAGRHIPLSPELKSVLKAADEVYKKSAGAFDPTLGLLVNMWGFGSAAPEREPSDNEIRRALKTTGFNKLRFGHAYKSISKKHAGTCINLSAIAKGYGVDRIAALLDGEGYTDYVIEIGGEIKTRGERSPESGAWTVGIRKPSKNSSENAFVLSLSNLAVATSGNYRNFYQKDGRIVAHTLSAKTGKPVETDVLSASVFHDSCMYADAYATAIMAMGVEKGLAFADKHKLKVILFDNNFTPRFSKEAAEIFAE